MRCNRQRVAVMLLALALISSLGLAGLLSQGRADGPECTVTWYKTLAGGYQMRCRTITSHRRHSHLSCLELAQGQGTIVN